VTDLQRLNVDICFQHNTPDCTACKPRDIPAVLAEPTPAGPATHAPAAVDLDETAAGWVAALRQADEQIAFYTGLRGRAIEVIQAAMGDATEARISGRPVITWKPTKPRKTLDRKALEAHYGTDVIAGFLREGSAARPFKVLDLPQDGT
jgi:hypothetical protein